MSQLKKKTQTDLLPYTQGETVALITLDRIDTAPQVRTEFEEEALNELAKDIEARGVIQPIIVRQVAEGRFLIVAGERRFRAAGIAGLKAIPALVRELDEDAARDMQLAENIQREELSLMETAKAIRSLYDREKKIDKVAELVKKSKSWVSKHLSLTMTDLSQHARRLLENGATEDMEILNLVHKVDREYGWWAASEMADAIRKGEMNRTKAREHVKQLKAEADAEAAEEEQQRPEIEPRQAANEAPSFILWRALEAIEERADEAGEAPNFFEIAGQVALDVKDNILAAMADTYQKGRGAFLATSERERLNIVLDFASRHNHDYWDEAAFALGYLSKELDLRDLVEEWHSRKA